MPLREVEHRSEACVNQWCELAFPWLGHPIRYSEGERDGPGTKDGHRAFVMPGGDTSLSEAYEARDKWNDAAGKKLKAWYTEKCREQNLPCWLCGQKIKYDDPPQTRDAFEPDHFHPRKTHPELAIDPSNLRPAHSSCNRSRGAGQPFAGVGRTSEDWWS